MSDATTPPVPEPSDGVYTLLANINDTLRSRGYGPDLGQTDERVIAMARDLTSLTARLAAVTAERDEDRNRVLALEAQVFKMAEWLLVEKRIAEETIAEDEVPDMMTDAYRQRIAEISALLSGSAGASHLADLSASRDAARADADRAREQRDEYRDLLEYAQSDGYFRNDSTLAERVNAALAARPGRPEDRA